MADEFASALERFRDWFADYSWHYLPLRTEVFIHDAAPLRLRQLWQTLGWAPGVGFGGMHAPLRPEREVTRKAAERVFAKWAKDPKIAQALGVTHARDIWARQPRHSYVQYAGPSGAVKLVDEAEGDDPPLLETNGGPPTPTEPSAASFILKVALRWHGWWRRMNRVDLRAPDRPGPFEPALPGLWQLAEGVWGLSDPDKERNSTPRIDALYYQMAENLIDYLTSLGGELPRVGALQLQYEALFTLKDLKLLHPDRLAGRGFTVCEAAAPAAVGRLDGLPLMVAAHDNAPTGFVYVPKEHVKAFRALMKREKLSSYDTQLPPRNEPSKTDRQKVLQLYEAAEKLARGGAKPPRRGSTKAKQPPATALEREAAELRSLLLAGHPGLELELVDLGKTEPNSIRVLWSTLGWSEELSAVAGWPDRKRSAHELRSVLEDYRSWNSPLKRSILPKRFRLVHVDEQGVGFCLSDETSDGDDPPLLFASSDSGDVETVSPSYVGWVGCALVEHALGALPGLEVGQGVLATAGDRPLPTLSPELRRLANGVYALPIPHSSDRWQLAATDLGALVDHLTGSGQRIAPVDGASIRGTAQLCVPGFTPIESLVRVGGSLFAGRLDSLPILIAGTRLHASLADLERATAGARALGWC